MSDGKKYYCFCGSNCKYETMTKEQILAAITQAVEKGNVQDVDTGFVTKVKENNCGGYVSFWCGTQAQYNALPAIDKNCLYIITDDTTTADLGKTVQDMNRRIEAAEQKVAEMMPIDVAEKVAISVADVPSGEYVASVNKNDFYVHYAKFLYSPSAKIVFYDVSLVVPAQMKAGQWVYLSLDGEYLPSSGAEAISSHKELRAKISNGKLSLYAYEDVSIIAVDVSGWYFCEGE